MRLIKIPVFERTHPDSVVGCSCRNKLTIRTELYTQYVNAILHITIHKGTGIYVNSNPKRKAHRLTRYSTQFAIHLGMRFHSLLQQFFVHRDSS